MKAFLAQWRTELALTFRQGEQMLVSIGIPIGVLVFFSQVDVIDLGTRHPADFLTPATMALAIMSTALVSLGIGTGFERDYGVLKRLGATPLGRPRWLAAKLATVLTVEAIQLSALGVIGAALGWRPGSRWAWAVPALILGTAAFAGLALFLAGALRSLTNLALVNGLYLLLMLLGGMVVPLQKLPGALGAIAKALPAAPLANLFLHALGPDAMKGVGPSWIVLGAWAVITPVLATRWFRWEPSD